jgi:citrate lyase subunit gamma (acyl carrier protein)
MKLKETAQSGSLESSDILLVVNPLEKGVGRKIEIESVVMHEYGDSIKADIVGVLDKIGVEDVHVSANDRGALSPTIKARTEAALVKSSGRKE